MSAEKVVSPAATTPAHARELTDWFPADVKPVHVGVYEAFMKVIEDRFGSYCLESGFAYWNGESWGSMHSSIKDAAKLMPWTVGAQQKAWRGIKEPS